MAVDEQWTEMWDVFHATLDLPVERRDAFLREACGDDDELRIEVLRNLEAHEQADGFLEPPIATSRPANAQRQSRMIGKRIGRYTITRVIATGGMGVVYEAEQDEPKRTVALKLMRMGHHSPKAARRFHYESEILARLQHPGIAQIYEAGTHDDGEGGVPYFAMELVTDALTLIDFARERKLEVDDRLDLLARICDAVHYGHQRGVIHRDLKPANILIGEAGRPRIIDFGVARATDADLTLTTMQTNVGQLVGTIQYMSPEQCAGDPDSIDTRSDVYSLGVILYELLCDRVPFVLTNTPIPEAARVIRDDSPVRPSVIKSTLKGDLETIVLKAMAKMPPERYQSAQALGEDIRRYLKCEPIEAHPPSPWYQMQKFAARNRLLVGGIALIIAFLVTGLAIVSWQAVALSRAEARAAQRSSESWRLARTIIFDIHDAIEHLPGSTPAREQIIQVGLQNLEIQKAEAEEDPAMLREIALAYERIANVQGGWYHNNLGDQEGARQSYQRALRLLQMVHRRAPSDEATADLARLYHRCGESSQREGEAVFNPRRRSYYERALETYDSLLDHYDEPEFVIEYAMFLRDYGFYKVNYDGDASAMEYFSRAVQISDSLWARYPDNVKIGYRAGWINFFTGKQYERLGDDAESWRLVVKAREIIDEVRQLDPLDTLVHKLQSSIMCGLAVVMAGRGDVEEAMQLVTQGREISEEMSAADPQNQRLFRSVEILYERVGHVYNIASRQEDATLEKRISWLQQACEWYQRVLERTVERNRLGWISPHEQHYIQMAEEQVDDCVARLDQLRLSANSELETSR